MKANRRRWALAVALATGAGALVAAPAAADSDDRPPPSLEELAADRYVVVLDEVPLVTEFGRDGVNSAAADERGAEMVGDQAAIAAAAGLDRSDITHSYTASMNGFAAELNSAQVEALRSNSKVSLVLQDPVRYAQTDSSTDFLGLTTQGGAHTANINIKGEGVVVGVIDNGIWPEHPSIEDDGTYPDLGIVLDASRPNCEFGNTEHNANDAPFECNNKLLGARQMLDTYRAVLGATAAEFDSARDDNGHGTHTATTAVGNQYVAATVFGQNLGQISGVAPRARLIAYKGLGELGGFGSDLAAAIDQAVFDGVDVINYSVGGGASLPLGPDDVAFLFAADAGVRVATSAGNSGPGAETIGGPAHVPWVTTVGANTQTRFFKGEVKALGGPTVEGASLTLPTMGRMPFVDAEDAGSELCIPGELDPAVVEGAVVLCRRGVIARAAKSEAVAIAGGTGMVLYNVDDVGNLDTDNHAVPSVHVNFTDGQKLKDYIDTKSNPRVALATGQVGKNGSAPAMAGFSSRGGNSVFSDITKPDITAPGVMILAGASPLPVSGVQGELFQAISGTSMSSPHIAGIFALMAEVHPDWSAAATKSAIMTTANTDVRDNDRVSQATPFEMGAGQVAPGKPLRKNSVFKPGLVYDADFLDYLGFLCGAAPAEINPATCEFLGGIGVPSDESDLNLPSIGVDNLVGSQTVTRRVTSVHDGKPPIVYTPNIEAPEGYSVSVMPESIRIRSGETATYQVTITNVSAPVGEWRHGSLTWDGGNYSVRSPISVRGVSIGTPAAISGEGVEGSASVPVSFGYTGEYAANAHGLETALVIEDNVVQDPDQNFDPDDGFSNAYTVETSGDAFLRFALPPDSVNDPNIDLDMFVFDPDGTQIASSTAGGTAEEVDIVLPADGVYTVYIHGWQTVEASTDFTLYAWVISATPGGNMSIDSAPASAVIANEATVDVSWTGATAGEWHLGAVSHADADGLLALTLVEVDNRGLEAEPG